MPTYDDIFRMQKPDYQTIRSLYREQPQIINIHEAVDRYQHPSRYLKAGYRPLGSRLTYSRYRRPYKRNYRHFNSSGYSFKKRWY